MHQKKREDSGGGEKRRKKCTCCEATRSEGMRVIVTGKTSRNIPAQ